MNTAINIFIVVLALIVGSVVQSGHIAILMLTPGEYVPKVHVVFHPDKITSIVEAEK